MNKAGIGKYAESLLENVVKKSNINVLLCSNKKVVFDKEIYVEIINSRNLLGKVNSNLWFQLILPSIIKKYRIDLFHGTMSITPILSDVPSVVTIYDLVLEIFPKTMHWKNWLPLKILMKNSANKASRIIAISENTKKDIIKYFGISPDKIKVIYLGVDKNFSSQKNKNDENILIRYNLLPGYILTVGTLEPRKNLIRLLNAYKMIVVSEDSIPKLVIVGGQGWLKEDINKVIDTLGLTEKVVLTGYVSDSDLPALYRNASVFVYPSLYEGFGLPPLEAMACGTPVISSNVSSIPEVVGDAGLLIDPYRPEEVARAITLVLKDNGLRVRLNRTGLNRAGLFTWDKTARETIKLYQEVIEENNHRRNK
ncbi:glycosyltransferase family 4 protein [Pelotomaculum terephthalicicum JT]|uniref:glycosyltransferase family 4 protein n=1 Tax=Pelotomaculum terephthalicicum TaxID=206393 RepID=UPI001F046301|nr:glycosyltransferase family 1 protein [Pelotomaculum terephthalicicum]MCG9966625.1 glycosyltransferase family 4 protein [Pelotomaculum terephthalicicum JT]